VPSRRKPSHRQWTPLGRALTVAGDNWTLIIAVQLAPGPTRLSQLRARLAGVSAGVLDRYVREMVRAGLVKRNRFREMPPRVELELTDAGRELLPIAGALARWGVRRAWSDPDEGEEIDVEALMRLLPVLLTDTTGLPDANVELTLEDGDTIARHSFAVRRGLVVADSFRVRQASATGTGDEDVGTPTVRIRGDRSAWTAALGPRGEGRMLRLAGDRKVARRVLAALPRPGTPLEPG
jgi:DNA-binding HxlR family transcriptional regulator